ncbi:MAG: RNA polymerase sigma factor [Caldisericia bacterium]|nr:RNA polymerase sigma factor [Caldisericia bacterium]
MEIPDKEIIERVKRGEKEMFGVLIDRYSDRIYSYFLKLIQDKDEAMSLTQETFYKVFKGIKNFDTNKDFFPYLIKIARNEGINFLNKYKKIEKVDYNDTLDYEKKESFDLKIILDEGIKKLPKEDREIILLFYMENLSYEEISNILNISIDNVKVKLHRAKEKLRKFLEVKDEF